MGSVTTESIKLSQSTPVELFVLDATGIGGGIERFCGQVNELGAGVTWQGLSYTPLPIEATGFEVSASGAFPRPRMRVGNVDTALGSLAQLVRQLDGLRGAKLLRHRTYARFLDAVNFAGGNAEADPLAEWPTELWGVDRTVDRNRLSIEWELANPLDVVGLLVPARTVHDNWCQWRYRSSDCGYTGAAVAMRDDTPTSVLAQDACSKRLTGCRLRFGGGVLPASFFPGVGKVRQL